MDFTFLIFWIGLLLDFTFSHLLDFWTFVFFIFPFWVSFSDQISWGGVGGGYDWITLKNILMPFSTSGRFLKKSTASSNFSKNKIFDNIWIVYIQSIGRIINILVSSENSSLKYRGYHKKGSLSYLCAVGINSLNRMSVHSRNLLYEISRTWFIFGIGRKSIEWQPCCWIPQFRTVLTDSTPFPNPH